MKLQVIESSEENLLLGTDFFEKTQTQWNFKDCALKLTIGAAQIHFQNPKSQITIKLL